MRPAKLPDALTFMTPDSGARTDSAGRDWLCMLGAELREGLRLYWQTASSVLAGSSVRLAPPSPEFFALDRNFFSALFLYSYWRVGIPSERRILYAAVNQCLRGMVTGCDNLLDNEYKMTLDTDLPAAGTRFRSVMDIMVSDRVLFEILLDYGVGNAMPADRIKCASAASLHALVRSGIQEASEEAGVAEDRLPPDEVLSTVHHYKTGMLFQCTWALPAVLERVELPEAEPMKEALYRIGIGCQIMDDMVDLMRDVRNRRHNYVASLVQHGGHGEARDGLAGAALSTESSALFFATHPKVLAEARGAAMEHLREGLQNLFAEEHQFMVEHAAEFIAGRIGIDRLLAPASRD